MSRPVRPITEKGGCSAWDSGWPEDLESLRETYVWHDENRRMIAMALAEARELPMMAPYHDFWDSATEVLAAAWRVRGRRRSTLKAAIALALSFDTHRTLTREQHLTDDQSIELMVHLADSA